MAWIEVHQTLERHPKTLKLMKLLKITRLEAIGLLVVFWFWCLDYAQDGDLTEYAADEIAEAIGWRGDPATLLDSLFAAGLIDDDGERLTVHNWADYAGRMIEKREANAKRMRDARASRPDATPNARVRNVQRTCVARATHVQGLPNQTIPNQTKPVITMPVGDPPSGVASASDDELPFAGPIEPVDPEEPDLPELIETTPPPVAAAPSPAGPDLTAPAKPAPKPRRDAYTDAFAAFWSAYPGGGDKQATFREWKAAGLERDEAQRAEAYRGLQEQIAHRRKCLEAHAWSPRWKDAENWLKEGGWEAKLWPIEADRARAPTAAAAPVQPARPKDAKTRYGGW